MGGGSHPQGKTFPQKYSMSARGQAPRGHVESEGEALQGRRPIRKMAQLQQGGHHVCRLCMNTLKPGWWTSNRTNPPPQVMPTYGFQVKFIFVKHLWALGLEGPRGCSGGARGFGVHCGGPPDLCGHQLRGVDGAHDAIQDLPQGQASTSLQKRQAGECSLQGAMVRLFRS